MKLSIKPIDPLPVFEKWEYDLGIQTACVSCMQDFKEGEFVFRDIDGLWCQECWYSPSPDSIILDSITTFHMKLREYYEAEEKRRKKKP